jgi:hypothetical protein
MTLTLTIDQKALVELQITDRVGNPATVDGVPAWASSDEAAVTVTPDADGMTAWVTAGDGVTAEAVMVTTKVDADLGEGTREIIGTLQVNVAAGEAQFVELQAGAPEPKA